MKTIPVSGLRINPSREHDMDGPLIKSFVTLSNGVCLSVRFCGLRLTEEEQPNEGGYGYYPAIGWVGTIVVTAWGRSGYKKQGRLVIPRYDLHFVNDPIKREEIMKKPLKKIKRKHVLKFVKKIVLSVREHEKPKVIIWPTKEKSSEY